MEFVFQAIDIDTLVSNVITLLVMLVSPALVFLAYRYLKKTFLIDSSTNFQTSSRSETYLQYRTQQRREKGHWKYRNKYMYANDHEESIASESGRRLGMW